MKLLSRCLVNCYKQDCSFNTIVIDGFSDNKKILLINQYKGNGMTRIPLNEAEVDKIMKASKSIIQDIHWEKNPNESWFKSEVEVKNKLKLNLKMHLNVNSKDYRLYSFTLILNNAFRITGIDVNGSHKNKHTDCNNWKGETHKHKWTDRCRDGWAYTPNDIQENSIESAFISFCKECEIDYKGKFDTLPPRQISLSRLKNDMR